MEILITCVVRGMRLWMQCPGCDDLHAVTLEGPGSWEFNGDVDAPTVSPSILVRYDVSPPNQHLSIVCHSFLRNGRWEFLSDSTHDLAGQTVDMVPLPEWFVTQDRRA